MTNEQAKSELMQIYMSLSEEKKQALDVLMAQADGEYQTKKSCETCKYGETFNLDCARCDDDMTNYAPKQADGDLISRQAVHETIEKWAGSMAVLVALPTREVRPLLDGIHKLPSVKPQEPKTGHWIDRWWEEGCEGDCVRWRCSECKELSCCNSNFCGDCGAKMVGPQEISDHNLKMWHDIYTEEKRRERSE